MNFYIKYLKYKTKYINLKKLYYLYNLKNIIPKKCISYYENETGIDILPSSFNCELFSNKIYNNYNDYNLSVDLMLIKLI
jgi:hypothetical protein